MDKQKQNGIITNGVFLSELFAIISIMFLLAFSGIMAQIDHAVAQLGRAAAGYIDLICQTNGQAGEVEPILQNMYLEQPIILDKRITENRKLMLGIKMATYARQNIGKLYVDIYQGGKTETFEIDMERVADNKENRLIFHTDGYQEGEIRVKIYSYDSTGENCIGIYVTDDLSAYDALSMNGEEINKNADIRVYIPSKYAKSEFRQVES